MFGRLMALALAIATSADAEPRTAGSPAAGPCFWMHGRLFAANGAPTFRIWRIGTARVLGVKRDSRDDAAIGDLPASVRALIPNDGFQADLYGDYRVCPLTPERPGRMRLVRLAQARRLAARPESAREGPH